MLKRMVSVHVVAFGEVEFGGRQVEARRYLQPKVAEIDPLHVACCSLDCVPAVPLLGASVELLPE